MLMPLLMCPMKGKMRLESDWCHLLHDSLMMRAIRTGCVPPKVGPGNLGRGEKH